MGQLEWKTTICNEIKSLSPQLSSVNDVIVKKMENVSLLSQVTFNALTKAMQWQVRADDFSITWSVTLEKHNISSFTSPCDNHVWVAYTTVSVSYSNCDLLKLWLLFFSSCDALCFPQGTLIMKLEKQSPRSTSFFKLFAATDPLY